jgi:hypothetical protein
MNYLHNTTICYTNNFEKTVIVYWIWPWCKVQHTMDRHEKKGTILITYRVDTPPNQASTISLLIKTHSCSRIDWTSPLCDHLRHFNMTLVTAMFAVPVQLRPPCTKSTGSTDVALLWTSSAFHLELLHFLGIRYSTDIRWCIQKFPDWPSRARTANGKPLCH